MNVKWFRAITCSRVRCIPDGSPFIDTEVPEIGQSAVVDRGSVGRPGRAGGLLSGWRAIPLAVKQRSIDGSPFSRRRAVVSISQPTSGARSSRRARRPELNAALSSCPRCQLSDVTNHIISGDDRKQFCNFLLHRWLCFPAVGLSVRSCSPAFS